MRTVSGQYEKSFITPELLSERRQTTVTPGIPLFLLLSVLALHMCTVGGSEF